MNGQIVLLGETARTIRTDERTFSGVRANVQMQLGGALERLVALVAGLRHFQLGLGAAFLALLR